MPTKAYEAAVKAAGPDDGLAEGEYRALVSVFGNVDSYGDKVMPGAFADTLQHWQKSGDPIPVYYSHRLDDPDFNIGQVVSAAETDAGLEVHAKLDLENPKARQVYRLLKGRRLTQHSFTYDVEDGGPSEDGGYNELRKLRLWEVGPTPIGANSATELLAVKAARDAIAALHKDDGAQPEDVAEEVAAAEPDGPACPHCGVPLNAHPPAAGEEDEAAPADADEAAPAAEEDGGEKSRSKAGRSISAKNEAKLRDALTAIQDVLASLGEADSQGDGKATTSRPAKDEEPTRAKSEEPRGCSPARARLLTELDLLGVGLD